MQKYPTLKNAPIVEAVIDIKVAYSDEVSSETLLSVGERIKSDYPRSETQRRAPILVEKNNNVDIIKRTETQVYGYRFWSEDKKQVVYCTKDGFAFSRLAPYKDWENFKKQAIELWEIFQQQIGSFDIVRLAVRNINRIVVDTPMIELGNIFTAPPVPPLKITNKIDNFLSRLTIHKPESEIKAMITKATAKDFIPAKPAFILDIDTFYNKRDQKVKEDQAWEIIEDLRNFKNDIFFTSITPEKLEEYK